MRYERFRWNETRGDQYDDWGCSTFWLEVEEDGYAARKMEVYDNGNVLKYDSSHFSDEYGMLPDVKLDTDELEESLTEFISADEFEAAWNSSTALNFNIKNDPFGDENKDLQNTAFLHLIC